MRLFWWPTQGQSFKYLGVWVDRMLRGNVQLEEKNRRVDWKDDMDEQS